MIAHFYSDLCTLHLALLCLEGSFVHCCWRSSGILERRCGLLLGCRADISSSSILFMACYSSLRMSLEVDRAIDNLLTLENDQH